MRSETLQSIDLIKDVLSLKLRRRSSGKPIQVISDFDETQCSAYVFSKRWNTHVPKIRTDLSQEAKSLVNPMCIATARTSAEPVSWLMWHKLSCSPMPLVAENGAVLVWPSAKVREQPIVEILATDEQVRTMSDIQQELLTGKIGDLRVPDGHEVVLRPGRVATVEVRAQEIRSKRGTPDDYIAITCQLEEMFANIFPFIEIVSSGSSLGIQPKGVSKEVGIRTALARAGVNTTDVFLVGIGDNKNDAPLFDFISQNGGLSIGVRQETEGLADFIFNSGDEATLQVLKTINFLSGSS